MTKITPMAKRASVGVPSYEYDSMLYQWRRSRAVLAGETAVKAFDEKIDVRDFRNLLIPFSPAMTDVQYKWYRSEAELPGLASQYLKVLLGGLLRKRPEIDLPEGSLPEATKEEALNWLVNNLTEDGNSLVTFMTDVLQEQLTTTGGYVSVDFPTVPNYSELDINQRSKIRPFPILWKAEEVINIQYTMNHLLGTEQITRIIFRYLEKLPDPKNPFHPIIVPTVSEHYLDDAGIYRVQIHRLFSTSGSLLDISNGELSYHYEPNTMSINTEYGDWKEDGEAQAPMMNGKFMTFIPVWPLSGSSKVQQPFLQSIIDKEVALYNKMSRRNHLLYGASTYTPVLKSAMDDEEFHKIVGAGLGTWIKIGQEDTIETLTTPTDALSDLHNAIDQTLKELAVLGTRILEPEDGAPGISLSIKNSIQISQLHMINVQLSSIMRRVISVLLEWRYSEHIPADDIKFELSADFDTSPTGAEWMNMITMWYQQRLIPRSVWLTTAKRHDVLPEDYDDDEGVTEISTDPLTMAQTYEPEIEE